VLPGKPPITRAVGWLVARQHQDGGWADDRAGGAGPAHAGPARASTARASTARASTARASTARASPALTGMALAALLAAGGAQTLPVTQRAADWLTRAQLPDGGWGYHERAGSPGGAVGADQLVVPLAALGRYLGAGRR
jgi:squalene cyclase